jgi:hypothetical protein
MFNTQDLKVKNSLLQEEMKQKVLGVGSATKVIALSARKRTNLKFPFSISY